MDLNIRVEVGVDANVHRLTDKQMDRQKDGQKTGSLYLAMLKAGLIKIKTNGHILRESTLKLKLFTSLFKGS